MQISAPNQPESLGYSASFKGIFSVADNAPQWRIVDQRGVLSLTKGGSNQWSGLGVGRFNPLWPILTFLALGCSLEGSMESRISSIADFQGSFRLSSLDSLGLAPDGFLDRISAVSFDVKAQCDGGEETNRKSVIGYDIAAAPTLDFDLSAACGGANVIIYNLNLQYRDVDGNLTPVAGLSADGVPFNHPVSGSQLILVRLSVPGKIANYNLQEVKIDTASNGNNVFAVNRPPTATNDGVFTVNSEQESVISVMGNDVDLDGDTIVVISVGSPSNGNAVLAADGKIYYTSNTSYVGPDSFTYRLKDSAGNFSGPATVTLNVQ